MSAESCLDTITRTSLSTVSGLPAEHAYWNVLGVEHEITLNNVTYHTVGNVS